MMRKITQLAVLCSAAALTAQAQADFSATVAVQSDYVYNGISQTDNDPALQGSVDWYNDAGFYAGVWASNVDFNNGVDVEVDYYVGYANSATDSIDYDVGYVYYAYPGAQDDSGEADYAELYGSLTFNENTTAVLSYSDEYSGDLGASLILFLSHSIGLANDYSLTFEASHTKMLDDKGNGAFRANSDTYTHWGASVGKNFSGFDVSLAYTDTNIKESYWGSDTADGRVVLGVSYSF